MQLDAAAHQTAFSAANCAPAGFGVGCTVHFTPSHRSASAPAPGPPTATQSVSETQDTAFRIPPGSVGMCCRRQVRPFHRRASVDMTPRVGPAVPTASHALVAGQAIPLSWFSAAPTGLGTACRRQRPSRHRSPSVTGVPAPLPRPTAVQSEAEGQDTPLRPLPLAWGGLGVDWTRQALPFHRSPNGTNAPELSTYPP